MDLANIPRFQGGPMAKKPPAPDWKKLADIAGWSYILWAKIERLKKFAEVGV